MKTLFLFSLVFLAACSTAVEETSTTALVNPEDIQSGGPPKDGIPSIDNPKFDSVEQADEWLDDDELIMVVTHNNITKAYPFQILVWHEIVNDDFNGEPVLITYCPLCGSGIAYEREINGEAVEFGTSGKLYNSNLIMYDRKTDTYWQQIGGQAIVGELTGMKLKAISADVIEWGAWKESNPDVLVLNRDTGQFRSYGIDPYGPRGYYESESVWFPLTNEDDRYHPKTVIYGVEVNGVFKAYLEEAIRENAPFEDSVGGETISIRVNEDSTISMQNEKGNELAKERDFWFAWAAFHPDTEVYEG